MNKKQIPVTGLAEINNVLIGQHGRILLDAINAKGERTPHNIVLLEGWDMQALSLALQSVRLVSPDVRTVHIKSIQASLTKSL